VLEPASDVGEVISAGFTQRGGGGLEDWDKAGKVMTVVGLALSDGRHKLVVAFGLGGGRVGEAEVVDEDCFFSSALARSISCETSIKKLFNDSVLAPSPLSLAPIPFRSPGPMTPRVTSRLIMPS
jgi:hypothetical protein